MKCFIIYNNHLTFPLWSIKTCYKPWKVDSFFFRLLCILFEKTPSVKVPKTLAIDRHLWPLGRKGFYCAILAIESWLGKQLYKVQHMNDSPYNRDIPVHSCFPAGLELWPPYFSQKLSSFLMVSMTTSCWLLTRTAPSGLAFLRSLTIDMCSSLVPGRVSEESTVL